MTITSHERNPKSLNKDPRAVKPQYSKDTLEKGCYVLEVFTKPQINVQVHQIKWALERAQTERVIPEGVTLKNTELSTMLRLGYIKEIAATLFPDGFKISVGNFEEKVAYTIFNFQSDEENGGWDRFTAFINKFRGKRKKRRRRKKKRSWRH